MEPEAPPELRARLRDWFVEELSITDTDVPVESPPSAPVEVSSPGRHRGGWWVPGAYAAIVVAVVAGLVVLGRRDVERAPMEAPPPASSPTASSPTTSSPTTSSPPANLDVGSLLTASCAELRGAAERLPLGADAAEVDRVSAGILIALDQIDSLLSGARGDVSVDEIRGLVAELRSRVDDLPSVAVAADRVTMDQTVANVDLLILAVGRRMEQAGGAGCAELSTMRERQ